MKFEVRKTSSSLIQQEKPPGRKSTLAQGLVILQPWRDILSLLVDRRLIN